MQNIESGIRASVVAVVAAFSLFPHSISTFVQSTWSSELIKVMEIKLWLSEPEFVTSLSYFFGPGCEHEHIFIVIHIVDGSLRRWARSLASAFSSGVVGAISYQLELTLASKTFHDVSVLAAWIGPAAFAFARGSSVLGVALASAFSAAEEHVP